MNRQDFEAGDDKTKPYEPAPPEVLEGYTILMALKPEERKSRPPTQT